MSEEAVEIEATGVALHTEARVITPQQQVVVTFQVPVTLTFGRNLHEIRAAVAAWPLTPEGRLSRGDGEGFVELATREFKLEGMLGTTRLQEGEPAARFKARLSNIVACQPVAGTKEMAPANFGEGATQ